jgi:ribosomal protein S18 acetylase RimI-like enzyme
VTHPLDRPVWNALTTEQAHLAVVSGAAVRIDPDYGPFAAARDDGDDAQAALAASLSGPEDRIGVVERENWPVPPGTIVLGGGDLVQMVWDGSAPDETGDPRIVLLGEKHAGEMAELAHATEPGPWGGKTHRYGDYFGIFVGRKLAAMAGERLRIPGFAELSGVSTGPEFRGQGLAKALVRHVLGQFVARGDTPFLHCYAANAGAIALYDSLGFRTRARMAFTILARA